ncbi:hypothetical protein EDC14_1003127 [Hydrogenispora ethanolica]|jgi:ribosomal-protein-alanine N-acetyltransferase|uniref:N-acetyltransferase domain-containing protein n=2 Tax=Hydrogenispora ethanolica TaxID=1082276 RepID=A0A4R1S748_HYDET|nr:hypothetical protein EDC14_1003127 [Hydrogenispora ethanolica]
MLLAICFIQLGLHRVTARCNARNLSSERVMQKAGMVKEGEFRKARFKNGGWDDECHYGILKEEWQAWGNSDGRMRLGNGLAAHRS